MSLYAIGTVHGVDLAVRGRYFSIVQSALLTFLGSPPLKASLILSYEYLRLYCNAFAYQATLNRLVLQTADVPGGPESRRSSMSYPFTDFVAATPDARFIYDSVDAAKSLLSTFNSFVDPVSTFRYMPLRYYLYVIYSACFLYKARSTGVLGSDRGSVKRMINDVVERLRKASACANDVGDRYSRLIKLLWRKPPVQQVPGAGNAGGNGAGDYHGNDATTAQTARPGSIAGITDMQQPDQGMFDQLNKPTSINAFSWLDLSAVGDFATNNNSISGSLPDGLDGFDESSTDAVFGGFDPSTLNGQQFATWNGIPPPGIIF